MLKVLKEEKLKEQQQSSALTELNRLYQSIGE